MIVHIVSKSWLLMYNVGMNLYSKFAAQFSQTRKHGWEGWKELLPFMQKLGELEILDLACGNGRFLQWAAQSGFFIKSYLGIDLSMQLLDICKQNSSLVKTFEIKQVDLNSWWELPSQKPNLVVAFGITHHLKSDKERLYLIKKSLELIGKGGIVAVSFWQFETNPAINKSIIESLGDNNYTLSFGSNGATRFCHFTDISEIEKLEEELGIKPFKTFRADGKNSQQNLYRIYKK